MMRVILALICVTCMGCGSAGETKTKGEAPAPTTSATASRSRVTPQESTRKEQPTLANDEVRVSLLVLPGDAAVEVDNVLVRRRQGTVELVGKVGDERRVRVFMGTATTDEQSVKIEATGTSPAIIDARGASFPK